MTEGGNCRVFKRLLVHIDAYRGRLFEIAVLRFNSEGAVIAVRDRIARNVLVSTWSRL